VIHGTLNWENRSGELFRFMALPNNSVDKQPLEYDSLYANRVVPIRLRMLLLLRAIRRLLSNYLPLTVNLRDSTKPQTLPSFDVRPPVEFLPNISASSHIILRIRVLGIRGRI